MLMRHRRDVWLRLGPAIFGLYAFVGGAISYIAWAADLPGLTTWDQSGISIQPNAAIAVMSAGASLLLWASGHRRASAILGVVVAFVGGSVLFEYLTGLDFGIDGLFLFDRTWGQNGVLVPGRMGPPGATSWLILGCGLVIGSISRPGARSRNLVLVAALFGAGIASLSLIGYLYGASLLYTIPNATIVALQTSSFILAVSIGLMLTVPDLGALRLIGEKGPAGMLIRRVLPAVIVLPVALGLLRIAGDRAGLGDLAIGTAVLTLVEMVLLLGFLWWAARAVNRESKLSRDAHRRLMENEAALRQSRRELEGDLADSQLLQRVSAELIHENDVESLYETILDAVVTVMRAQYGCMQRLDVDRAELKLLRSRGFSSEATKYWEWVSPGCGTICGEAMRVADRVIVPDVSASEFAIGAGTLARYADIGIRAAQSTPLFSRTGQILGMISTYWSHLHTPSDRELRLLDIMARQAADLIERRQTEEALRQADRHKDEFLATLAHELRNPLAPLRSAVDLMKLRRLDPPVGWARDVIDRQIVLMTRLLDDLLDVGRIARNTLELRKERVDLGSIIRASIELCQPLLDRFQHQLRVSIPPQAIEVDADPVRLGQVFGNLLNNACRYSEPNGQIRIEVDTRGTDAVVTVKDTGIGIPPDKLSVIFNLFAQVDRSMERSKGGLGIGLYLVKRIVQLHGGDIEAHSEGADCGSQFVVRLPALASSARDSVLASSSRLGCPRGA